MRHLEEKPKVWAAMVARAHRVAPESVGGLEEKK